MKKAVVLSLFLLLFTAFVVVWNYSYQKGLEEAYIPITHDNPTPSIPSESGTFERSSFALDYAKIPEDVLHQRSLETYYENRAFNGAPPSIPHAVKEDGTIGAMSCLQCHQNGGFVSKFNAYTPVTPHPEMLNCRQCHVAQKSTSSFFKQTNFSKPKLLKVGGNKALVSSPPVIPHQIQMRENCLSCHAGPSAPKEIRVSHPERINCRQCHVMNNKEVTDIGVFRRNENEK